MGILEIVAQNVRYERKRRGLSQPQLAYKAGVATSGISHIERAKRNVGIATLEGVAFALGVPLVDLLIYTPRPNIAHQRERVGSQ